MNLQRFNALARRRRGFRLSIVDVVAIAACAIATWFLFPQLGTFVWLLPVTLGHFFLFCNVFRVRRTLELRWAVVFVVNVGFWTVTNNFSWLSILLVQLPVTAAVIIIEIRSPRYHGVFCDRNSADSLDN